MSSKYWTPARTAQLLNLRARGLSTTEIAKLMGGRISGNAVASKLRRLLAKVDGARRTSSPSVVVPLQAPPVTDSQRLLAATERLVRLTQQAEVRQSQSRRRPINIVRPKEPVHRLRTVPTTQEGAAVANAAEPNAFEQREIDATTLAEVIPFNVMMIGRRFDVWYSNQRAKDTFALGPDGTATTDVIDDPDFRTGVEDALRTRNVRDVQFPKQWGGGPHYRARICPFKSFGAAVFIEEIESPHGVGGVG